MGVARAAIDEGAAGLLPAIDLHELCLQPRLVGGILDFPWAAVELCLLAVHPQLVELAETVLATTDVRLYSAEAWAKYTGAAEYDQELHRDYLNHPAGPNFGPTVRSA